MNTQIFRSDEGRETFEKKFTAAMRFCNQSAEDFGWVLDDGATRFEFGPFRIVEDVRKTPGRPQYVRYNLEHYEATNLRHPTGSPAYKQLQSYSDANEALSAMVLRRVRDGIVNIFSIMDEMTEEVVDEVETQAA